MDGVVANFNGAIWNYINENKLFLPLDNDGWHDFVEEICKKNPTIFHDLDPIEGSIESVIELHGLYDLYFLSTPMWELPESFTGKRVWLEKHFGDFASKRLILTHRKDLNIGDFLIDDRIVNGVENFKGEHIHFGTEKFPDWSTTTQYLKEKL